MRILITGTTGFVGHKLKASYTDAIAAPSLRNATRDMIMKIVEESEADVVIHTAAISDIGTCQKDPQSSYFANVQIPLYLAAACKDRKLICFSSDQVYSACKEEGPYIEEVVKPGNIYAEHKLWMMRRRCCFWCSVPILPKWNCSFRAGSHLESERSAVQDVILRDVSFGIGFPV